MRAFALRNSKELLRDPFSLIFGVGLSVALLLLMNLLQKSISIPVNIFELQNFTPGIALFSFTFTALFSGLLIAKDRQSSFLTRLFASPLSAADYIFGYSVPLLPMAFLQAALCFLTALILGLTPSINILWCLFSLLPSALLFIGFGLLFGSIFTDRQVGPFSSILIQVTALLSGMWFDLSLIGGVFKSICYLLPFAHAVDAAKAALMGNFSEIFPHLLWVIGYTIAVFIAAVLVFRKKMKS